MQKNIIISLIMEWDRFETIPKLLAVCFPGYCEVNKFLSVAWVVRVAVRHVTPMWRYKGWNNQHVRKCQVFVDLLISVNWTLLKTLPLLHIRERKKDKQPSPLSIICLAHFYFNLTAATIFDMIRKIFTVQRTLSHFTWWWHWLNNGRIKVNHNNADVWNTSR